MRFFLPILTLAFFACPDGDDRPCRDDESCNAPEICIFGNANDRVGQCSDDFVVETFDAARPSPDVIVGPPDVSLPSIDVAAPPDVSVPIDVQQPQPDALTPGNDVTTLADVDRVVDAAPPRIPDVNISFDATSVDVGDPDVVRNPDAQ